MSPNLWLGDRTVYWSHSISKCSPNISIQTAREDFYFEKSFFSVSKFQCQISSDNSLNCQNVQNSNFNLQVKQKSKSDTQPGWLNPTKREERFELPMKNEKKDKNSNFS